MSKLGVSAVSGLVALAGLSAFSCAARPGVEQSECRGPDLLSTPLSGGEAILVDGSCTFEEEQDGHTHRVVCNGETCLWQVDGEETCVCQRLDYANRCGNGVPMCADWQDYFDFSAL